ncbi:MAG: putative toxin-antitoxin system toxin component, PIN family [Aridibacter sp.]
MPLTNIKTIFDCNIIWQSFFFEDGVSAKCKRLVDDGIISLFLSLEVLEEMREVMTRPEFLVKFETITVTMVETYLQELAKKSILIKSVPAEFKLPRDTDDEIYINLAVESDADFIVTRDKDLLDLMSSYDSVSKEFRQRFRPLKIVEPLEFLQIVNEQMRKDLSLEP